MGRYKEVDDEGVELPGGKHFFELACCDCGLVHKVYYSTEDGKLIMFFDRDDRSTAQLRRHNQGQLIDGTSIGKWKMVRKED